MPERQVTAEPGPDGAWLTERARLVWLCAHLCGDPAAAEDLAQETLAEASRQAHKLRDPEALGPWLSAIARYMCLRWARQKAREPLYQLSFDGPGAGSQLAYELADGFDLEIELERSELGDLLDRAMSALPEETRLALLFRYVEDRPLAEVAARLGLTEGAVAMRLQRGKAALRRVLLSDLQEDARAYGLLALEREEWQPTRVWCPLCGKGRLSVLSNTEKLTFVARCPACQGETSDVGGATYLREVRGPWRTLLRSHRESHAYFRAALADGTAPCLRCGRPTPTRISVLDEEPGIRSSSLGVSVRCAGCGTLSFQPASGLALTVPEVQDFWRRQRRMRMLPLKEIEVEGQPALLARFESVTGATAVDVVSLRRSLNVVGVYGDTEEIA